MASLLVCIEKNGSFRFQFFCGWHHKWGRFWHFWLRSSSPELQPQETIFWLKFVLETRLKSESFEPLIGFQAFLVKRFGQKNKFWVNKTQVWVKRYFIQLLFFGRNVWTRNTIKPFKGSKDSDYSLVPEKILSQKFLSSVVVLKQEPLNLLREEFLISIHSIFNNTMQKHTPLQPLSRNRRKLLNKPSHKHYTNPSKKKTKFTGV